MSSNDASLLDSKYTNSEDGDYEKDVGGDEEHGDAGMCMALFFCT